ncbi:hypothetical protein F5X99DRAFT_37332 [Biscogniauxia marginata]|nr:hypothetical protein F5X99DRAFT_37332 [Biscogniauxia marginata]
MAFSFLRNLSKAIFSVFLIVFVVCSFTSASSSSPLESPSAETELLCHTDNPAECYPKVFVATEEFQVVHDDQDLPPGLHVQLDVQTGQKQAKLYNPTEENSAALEGLPVDQAVIVVDPGQQPNEPHIPAGAPAYEPIGVVKEPREKNEGFAQAVQIVKEYLKQSDSARHDVPDEVLQALDTLEELSHDMYYGLQIAQDAEAVETLFCLLAKRDATQVQMWPVTARPDFLASSVLAATVANNAPALRELERSWDAVMGKPCKFTSRPLRHELYHELAPATEPGSEGEALEADFARLNLAVLHGLLKSPKIRDEFMDNDGMRSLLLVLLREGEAWAPRRARAAEIVSDTFLDEDIGATLGIWPTQGPTDAAICAEGGPESLGDECWEYHLEKIGRESPDAANWSKPLLSLLQQRRPRNPESSIPSEQKEL